MNAATESLPQNHKWMVLSNTTLGMLAAAINGSILLISLPAVFRGIGLKPLDPGNINYLLWAIIGYMVATAVLVVTFGRLGDQFGRARMYNLGFADLHRSPRSRSACCPARASFAAIYLIAVRIIQGIGGALIMANSTALLIDAFPPKQRGLALGINVVAAIGGQFIGLLIGGLLADTDWRLVFWINVPFGAHRHGLGLSQAARCAEPVHATRSTGPATSALALGLVADPDRHHLRHPALWRPGHGLGQPAVLGAVRRRLRSR